MKKSGNSSRWVTLRILSAVALVQACGGNDDSTTETIPRFGTGGGSGVVGVTFGGGASSQHGTGGFGAGTGGGTLEEQGGVGTIDVTSHVGGQSTSSSSSATGGQSTTTGSTATGGRAASMSGGTSAGGTTNESPVSSIDILYMIDNSASMADKQQVLAASLPQLLAQLVQPNCVDGTGQRIAQSQWTANGPTCAAGSLEFPPVNDIHLGIVSSSLGDHGANTLCTPGVQTQYTDPVTSTLIVQPPDVNDMGRLQGSTARGSKALQLDTAIVQNAVVKLDPKGFLAWSAGGTTNLATSGDVGSATAAFKDMVVATAQAGCGYESQLESWFRFLIDPVPPQYPISPPDSTQQTHRAGVDDALLAQRAAFLRPNSLVLIVMLTDENDCSLRDTDVAWIVAKNSSSITTGSPACATNPNDKCCYSCTTIAPAGCVACASPAPAAVDDSLYQANVRCYNQKRRFGHDFMYPTSRYYVALTHKELCPDQSFGDMDCDCTKAKALGASCSPGSRRLPNPLFSQTVGTDSQGNAVTSLVSAAARSDNSNILVAGIIGVPWQDISEPSSQGAGASLTYIPVTDARWTTSGGIWSQIYADDALNIAPGDTHMVESVVPRSGLLAPTSASATADPKSGHEYNTARADLEYACIFALDGAAPARPCACNPTDATYASCKYLNPNDCCDMSYLADGAGGPGANYNKPLCQDPTTGIYGTKQYFAKAYPGLREIAVLHDYAVGPATYSDVGGTNNSIVTSICPKVLTVGQESTPGYGYNPIARAIIDRLKGRLKK